jgi:hypothetical protein
VKASIWLHCGECRVIWKPGLLGLTSFLLFGCPNCRLLKEQSGHVVSAPPGRATPGNVARPGLFLRRVK